MAQFDYNKKTDEAGIWADLERDISDEENKVDNFHISPRDYHGTHELGHVMASTLYESGKQLENLFRDTTLAERMESRTNGRELPTYAYDYGYALTNMAAEEDYGFQENDMLETVLAKDQNRLMRQNNMYELKKIQQRCGFWE